MKKSLVLLLSIITCFYAVGCGGGAAGGKTSLIIPETNYVQLVTGQSYTINVKTFTIDGVAQDKSLLQYSSSNTNVLTVAGNVVRAVGSGTAIVSIKYDKTEAKIMFEATSTGHVLDFVKTEESLVLGKVNQKTLDITFTQNGQNLDKSQINFQTSNPSVATIDNGVVTAVGEGETTVTAMYGVLSDTVKVKVYQRVSDQDVTALNANAVIVQGRAYKNGNTLVFDNVNSGLEFNFYGTELKIKLNVDTVGNGYYCYLGYFIDGIKYDLIKLNQIGSDVEYTLASNLSEGIHTVSLAKATEQELYTAGTRQLKINSIVTGENCVIVNPTPITGRIKIDFYGDSITCGAGNLGGTQDLYTTNEDGTMSYAAITGRNLNALVSMVSYSGITVKANVFLGDLLNIYNYWDKYSTINNTACTIDTSTNFVVINLGTNDANASGYTVSTFQSEFKSLLTAMKAKYTGNTKFIWCYGMMQEVSKVKTGIQNALAEMGGERAGFYYLTLPANQQGANGHPSVAGHQSAATVLTNFINGLLNK